MLAIMNVTIDNDSNDCDTESDNSDNNYQSGNANSNHKDNIDK